MVYQLLVNYRTEPVEPVATRFFKVIFKLTNIGDDLFKGGKIDDIKLTYQGATQMYPIKKLPIIPELGVGMSFEFESDGWMPSTEGQATINLTVKSGDDKIVLYRYPDYSDSFFYSAFYVKSKELTDILEKLNEILLELQKRKG